MKARHGDRRPSVLGWVVLVATVLPVAGWVMTGGAAAAATGKLSPTDLRQKGHERIQFERNRALWGSLHLRNYSFRIRFGGFPVPGGYPHLEATVHNGRASGERDPRLRQGTQGLSLDSVPNLFREIRHVLADPLGGPVVAQYDRLRGFPRRVSIEPHGRVLYPDGTVGVTVDDGYGWTIDRFRVLAQART